MVGLCLQNGTINTLSILKLAFLECLNTLPQGLIYRQLQGYVTVVFAAASRIVIAQIYKVGIISAYPHQPWIESGSPP